MPNPTISDVHVDAALSNISTAILQNPNKFIADKVFPRVPVLHKSDKYYKYPRSFFNRTEAQERAPGTEAAQKDYAIETDTYSCQVYTVKHLIADQIRANSDPAINLDADAATLLAHDLLIQKDVKWASTYFGGGIWTGGDVDGVAGTPGTGEVRQWSDTTNGTPVTDIDTAITSIQASTGLRPNTVVMGREVFDKVKRHPEFIDLINGGATTSQPALAQEEMMANILGVERVLVFESIQNTAKEGQTASHSFIGGKKCLVTYTASTPGLMTPTAGYSFSWNQYAGFDVATKKYRREHLAADTVEAETAYDMKLVSSELGYFFDNIVA